MSFHSALYRGELVHARHDAFARAFRYPVYMASIDPVELPAIDRALRLFSHGSRNLFALDQRDYTTQIAPAERGRSTRLVTNLRTLGYVFNPVSFFIDYDGQAPGSLVAEVNNTYGGRRCYTLGAAQRLPGSRPGFRCERDFFVSPFLHGALAYDFWLDAPLDGAQLVIEMHVHARETGKRVFTARFAGDRTPLTDRALAAAALRYPWMTAQVIALIHWQALKLHVLGAPYHRPGAAHRPIARSAREGVGPNRIIATAPARTQAYRHHAAGLGQRSPGSSRRPTPDALTAGVTFARAPVADVAHPLIVPLPRLVPGARQLLRRAALRRLRTRWLGGRLDLVLPTGELVKLGGDGSTDARAHIHDDRVFLRLLLRGEMGAGEAFVAGEWSSDDLVAVSRAFLRGTAARGLESPLTRLVELPALARHRSAANTLAGSARNIHAHYDLGNAFYALFLDDTSLAYSCALFETGDSEADAQRRKLERMCDLLALSPRDHLLEIGCGWGGMAIDAARTRGCRVTAITISRAQHELACARVAAAGLSERVRVELRDYRDVAGTFDKIVSIEMLEAVGFAYLPAFFATCARALAPGGALAVQTITMPDERFDAYRRRVDWMQTYVFPGSCIPSLAAIQQATPAGLTLVHADDIGASYAPTLRAWRERFLAALPDVRRLGFDEPFIRTWLVYLAFSEAAFAERTLGDHQLLFTSRA